MNYISKRIAPTISEALHMRQSANCGTAVEIEGSTIACDSRCDLRPFEDLFKIQNCSSAINPMMPLAHDQAAPTCKIVA